MSAHTGGTRYLALTSKSWSDTSAMEKCRAAPARRAGGRTGLERGLDDGDDELRGLRVYDNVPAEQHAADDLPGVPGRVLRVGGHVSPPC